MSWKLNFYEATWFNTKFRRDFPLHRFTLDVYILLSVCCERRCSDVWSPFLREGGETNMIHTSVRWSFHNPPKDDGTGIIVCLLNLLFACTSYNVSLFFCVVSRRRVGVVGLREDHSPTRGVCILDVRRLFSDLSSEMS